MEELVGRYRAWLDTRRGKPCEVVAGLNTAGVLRLDHEGLAARGWEDLPLDWVPEHGTVLAGGYAEERAIYDTHVFAPDGEEPRTVHLGLDIFAPAGTQVFAPLDGHVHSVQLNDNPKDYGPTLILEHALTAKLNVFTLYGHLAPEVLDNQTAGAAVSAGELIARFGESSVNGGWAPHLHFQVMLDMQGRSGDFPGVARRSEAADWLALCPDPRGFLGLTHL